MVCEPACEEAGGDADAVEDDDEVGAGGVGHVEDGAAVGADLLE